ncbi:MAG: glycosyltransferase [Phycisphaerae bacterium]|nr:glycosyltransferase [Phycisphaerae bacterium]
MIEGRNIICIASNWAYDPTSKHHVMRILSERNHVIWVNYHASRRPRANCADAGAIVRKLRQAIKGPQRVDDRMTVITPLVVPLPGSQLARSVNRRLLTWRIRRVLRELPPQPIQLWSFAPDVDYLCGQFGEECVVYYCVDAFSEFDGYDREHVLRAEQQLMGRADLVVTTSRILYEEKSHPKRRTVTVSHGVDYDHFVKAREIESVPSDVIRLPRPIIGFWGLMQEWFDAELVGAVAAARPDWTFVLIGEVACDATALNLPNVHRLGRRPYSDLPKYAAGFDVALIPFRVNKLTQAVNPIKLREYLCAGLPVVSTPMPEVAAYREFVEIAEGMPEFLAACERALARRGEAFAARSRTAMQRETWRAKVHELSDHVGAAVGQAVWTTPLALPLDSAPAPASMAALMRCMSSR